MIGEEAHVPPDFFARYLQPYPMMFPRHPLSIQQKG